MSAIRPMTPWFHLAAVAAFLTSFGGGPSRAAEPGKLVLSCLEIPFYGRGVGLAIVIETPGGKVFLYDTGSGYPGKNGGDWTANYNAGRDAVLPFLKLGEGISVDRRRS